MTLRIVSWRACMPSESLLTSCSCIRAELHDLEPDLSIEMQYREYNCHNDQVAFRQAQGQIR